jgi:hypothetical protein
MLLLLLLLHRRLMFSIILMITSCKHSIILRWLKICTFIHIIWLV